MEGLRKRWRRAVCEGIWTYSWVLQVYILVPQSDGCLVMNCYPMPFSQYLSITLLGTWRSCHLKWHQNSVHMLPAWTQYSSVVEFNIDSAFKQNQCDAELRVVHIPLDTFTALVKRRGKAITLSCALLTRQTKAVFSSRSEHGGRRKRECFPRFWMSCKWTSRNMTEILTAEPEGHAEIPLRPFAVFPIEVGDYKRENPFCNGQDVEKPVQNVLSLGPCQSIFLLLCLLMPLL